MTQPVYFVEINSPDLARSREFFVDVFSWDPQPFASADYLVAASGSAPGIDTALLASRDGQARTVPILRVDSLDHTTTLVRQHGGTVVVEPFVVTGMGRACYIIDPTGVLVGLHEYDFAARA